MLEAGDQEVDQLAPTEEELGVLGLEGRQSLVGQPSRGLSQGGVEDLEELVDVGLEASRAELQGLTVHELGQAGWDVVEAGHLGPVHQDGDDPDVASQGGLDLEADEVAGVVEPASSLGVGGVDPPVADEGQQHVTGAHGVGEHLDEVVARFDGVHVLEDLAPPEVAGQAVEEPAGRVGGVLSPVADEDATGRRLGHHGCDGRARRLASHMVCSLEMASSASATNWAQRRSSPMLGIRAITRRSSCSATE